MSSEFEKAMIHLIRHLDIDIDIKAVRRHAEAATQPELIASIYMVMLLNAPPKDSSSSRLIKYLRTELVKLYEEDHSIQWNEQLELITLGYICRHNMIFKRVQFP